MISETSFLRRKIPLSAIVFIALAVHAPLLIMGLPLRTSYDANFHIFFASHYAQHWFDPWNEKWFAGFSQTTYPPLVHQWIALLSRVIGLNEAFMVVMLFAVVLIPVSAYRFSRLWVSERAASYAALLSIFAGTVSFLVYSAGQLPTVLSFPLYLLAVTYFYQWTHSADWRALLKGLALTLTAASVHHVTLIFGSLLFALPVLWLAMRDRNEEGGSQGAVLGRAFVFTVIAVAGVGVVLLPYWLSIIQHPIKQVPIPHASRSNLVMNLNIFINYFIVPYGAFILALPFVVIKGASVPRLRPLLLAFWFTFILGLGGTTPLPRWIFGRAFDILTFERFTLWAVLLGLPMVGMWAEELIDRHDWKAGAAFATAAVVTIALAMGWLTWSPFRPTGGLDVSAVVEFLNRDGHDQYRYLTLGFGNALPKLSTYANAGSVDGEYNSARLLPEMTNYGAAQFTSAKYFGSAGMESLKAMLRHANHYGLKYIFVYDPYYEPLLVFTGWRQTETFNQGAITAWVKDDVPPAHKIISDAIPAPWEGLLWGTLPVASSLLAIFLVIALPDRRRARVENVYTIPSPAGEPVFAREVRP
ncbi:MAG TPA: hypothetical protein VF011_05070 [Terriglobales bacterium]